MAIIWMDGPDHYGTDTSLLLNGVYAEIGQLQLIPNSGPGGQGTTFLHGINQPSLLRKVLPGNRTALGMGSRWYNPTLQQQAYWTLRDQFNNDMAYLQMLTTGALRYIIFEPGGPTVVAQTDPVIVAQSFQFIELFVDFKQDNTGKLRIGVDGITIVDIDAVRTAPYNNPNPIAQLVCSLFSVYQRDYYIWDTTGPLNNSGMQGDRQIVTTYPEADTAFNDWAPSSGALGWPLVSNVPPDDTDFIVANEAGQISEFEFGDIDTDITNISAVRVVARTWKSDAGLATIKLRATSVGDTDEGVESAVSTNKIFLSSIFETDPHTGVKWLPNAVNLATFGIERSQ